MGALRIRCPGPHPEMLVRGLSGGPASFSPCSDTEPILATTDFILSCCFTNEETKAVCGQNTNPKRLCDLVTLVELKSDALSF